MLTLLIMDDNYYLLKMYYSDMMLLYILEIFNLTSFFAFD